jgi:predicted Fe-S protein YdhL (DUF1289 family)
VSGALPASPCTGVCALDPASGYCRGCWRSMAEIAAWPGLADGDRRRILAMLPARRQGGGRALLTPGQGPA